MTDMARITVDLELEEPSWNATSADDPRIDRARIHLTGVRDSAIAAAHRVCDVDSFSVQSESPRLWRYGGSGAIHCDGPIPDPVSFLLELSDWIYEQRAPEELRYYCGEESFVSLTRRLSQGAFPLIAGPNPIVEEAARRLARLGVPHRLESDARRTPSLLVVTLGESWIVCDKALIELNAQAG